jgi:hypothetical protein
MTLTVRLSPRVEQELAEYCVKRRLTKSEAVKLALEELLRLPETRKADLSHPYIGSDIQQGDVARHVKRLLRERFRDKRTAYDLGKDLVGPHTDALPTEDIARHSGRLLREHFRGKKGSKRKVIGAK